MSATGVTSAQLPTALEEIGLECFVSGVEADIQIRGRIGGQIAQLGVKEIDAALAGECALPFHARSKLELSLSAKRAGRILDMCIIILERIFGGYVGADPSNYRGGIGAFFDRFYRARSADAKYIPVYIAMEQQRPQLRAQVGADRRPGNEFEKHAVNIERSTWPILDIVDEGLCQYARAIQHHRRCNFHHALRFAFRSALKYE